MSSSTSQDRIEVFFRSRRWEKWKNPITMGAIYLQYVSWKNNSQEVEVVIEEEFKKRTPSILASASQVV